MTIEEIKCVANEWSDNFDSNIPNFARIKRDVALLSYKKGATMVNQKQPYTAQDMEAFAEWCRIKGFFYEVDNKIWCNYYTEPVTEKTTAQLREMWEVTRDNSSQVGKEATE